MFHSSVAQHLLVALHGPIGSREKSTTAVMEFLFCFELVYWSTGESCECHAELRSQYNVCLPSPLHPTTHFLILIQYKLN